jgi:hypothetical protein
MSDRVLPPVPVTEVPISGGGFFVITAHIDGLPSLTVAVVPAET